MFFGSLKYHREKGGLRNSLGAQEALFPLSFQIAHLSPKFLPFSVIL
jgi:hypothetical protein